MGSDVLHGDDTPVSVLALGACRTKTGRLCPYVRDERPHRGERPPVAMFFYSADRKGEHPVAHLADFTGVLHADGYAGTLSMGSWKYTVCHVLLIWVLTRSARVMW